MRFFFSILYLLFLSLAEFLQGWTCGFVTLLDGFYQPHVPGPPLKPFLPPVISGVIQEPSEMKEREREMLSDDLIKRATVLPHLQKSPS